MNATHFSMFQSNGKRFFRGALCTSHGAIWPDIDAILSRAFALRLISPLTFHVLRWNCIDSFSAGDAFDFAVDEMCNELTKHAAPGYEFTAWLIDGQKVWGWFPREG